MAVEQVILSGGRDRKLEFISDDLTFLHKIENRVRMRVKEGLCEGKVD